VSLPVWCRDWDAFAAWAAALAKEHADRTPEDGVRRSLDAFGAWGVPVPPGFLQAHPDAVAASGIGGTP